MDGLALLTEASAAGLAVQAEGDKLVVRGPKRAEPIALRLLAAKPAVMEALGRIRQPSLGIPTAWREGVARMRRMTRPEAIPLDTWIALCSAADAFLAGPWARQASELGWDTLALFGAHRRATEARSGSKGLIWHLARGLELVALTTDAATLRTRTGSLQRLPQRRPDLSEMAAIWDLSADITTPEEHHDPAA